MDPLTILRDAIIQKQEIQLFGSDKKEVKSISDASHLAIFPLSSATLTEKPVYLPLSIPTRLFIQKDGKKEYQPLSVVYFAYLRRESTHGQYFQECRELGLTNLAITVRPALVDWLGGAVDKCAALDEDHVPELFVPPSEEDVEGDSGRLDELESSPATKRLRTEDSKDSINVGAEVIVLKERVHQDRNTAIIGHSTSKTFDYPKKLIVDILIKKIKKAAGKESTSGDGKRESSRSKGKHPASQESSVPQNPIIIVPGALTSLLTMYNVQSFLGKSSYETSDAARQRNPQKPITLTVERTLSFIGGNANGKKVTFEIVESILKPADWNRVVAVFVGGQAWQFRGWRWEDPVDLFSNVKGFYLKYTDSAVDSLVKSWNVNVLEISRFKRHNDAQCVHQFWSIMEQWLASKFPQMIPK